MRLKYRHRTLPDPECAQLQNIQRHEDPEKTTHFETQVV